MKTWKYDKRIYHALNECINNIFIISRKLFTSFSILSLLVHGCSFSILLFLSFFFFGLSLVSVLYKRMGNCSCNSRNHFLLFFLLSSDQTRPILINKKKNGETDAEKNKINRKKPRYGLLFSHFLLSHTRKHFRPFNLINGHFDIWSEKKFVRQLRRERESFLLLFFRSAPEMTHMSKIPNQKG